MTDHPRLPELRAARLRQWPPLPQLVSIIKTALEARADGAQLELELHLGAAAALLEELELHLEQGGSPWEK